jgi:acetyl-CoA acetyltransferase
MTDPLHDVCIAGVFNTVQARKITHTDSKGLMREAIDGVLAETGLSLRDIDGLNAAAESNRRIPPAEYAPLIGLEPRWIGAGYGIPAILEAAQAIVEGKCHTALIGTAQTDAYTERAATAPWTRPDNEFVACFGMFTAAEFALIARRHMYLYGTSPEHLAEVAATIRNNGHRNPEAVYYGRGPFTREEILNSRMVADPFHLLDCAMTSEGGCALILTTEDRARDLRTTSTGLVRVLGGGSESVGVAYTRAPVWDEAGYVGRKVAREAFQRAGGIGPKDVDVCIFYDPFSFEIIRQFEAFGFCAEGEGGPFVMDGRIALDGEYPIVTDGGTMSFSHAGSAQFFQRVIEAVKQLRGEAHNQVPGAKIAVATNGGAGALFTWVIVLGRERP